MAEQQERLCANLPPPPPSPSPVHEEREEVGQSCASGLVRVTEAGDSERQVFFLNLSPSPFSLSFSISDDDLEPYDMSHDPDNTQTPPPHYLLDCLSGKRQSRCGLSLTPPTAVLVSPTERGPVEAALSSLPSLISREPSDLSEVCVDLGRALVHLQDSWDLPSFTALRHSALVSLTTARPRLLAPFLVTEFYSPNHNLRQRLDILEVVGIVTHLLMFQLLWGLLQSQCVVLLKIQSFQSLVHRPHSIMLLICTCRCPETIHFVCFSFR